MSGTTLRRLVPADAPGYRALMLEAYARHPDAFTSSAAERAALPLAWWEARLDPAPQSKELVLGAFRDDRLAAAAGLAFETREKARHKATLFGMYVAPECRRTGVGADLVTAVLACARQRPGVVLVQLTVSDGNAQARALYERCGFAAFGREPYAVALGAQFVAKIHMWCDLRGGDGAAIAPAARMHEIEIRRGAAGDAPRLTALALQVWLDTYATEGIREPVADYALREFTLARTAQLLADPAALVLVAERAAHLVGFAVAAPGRAPPERPGEGAAELDRLYVQAPFSRTGIGTRLLAAMEGELAARQVGLLWLKVWVHNARARRFYERHGFADIGVAHFALDGERHENRVLAKSLAPG